MMRLYRFKVKVGKGVWYLAFGVKGRFSGFWLVEIFSVEDYAVDKAIYSLVQPSKVPPTYTQYLPTYKIYKTGHNKIAFQYVQK